jgi:hypothetical protein
VLGRRHHPRQRVLHYESQPGDRRGEDSRWRVGLGVKNSQTEPRTLTRNPGKGTRSRERQLGRILISEDTGNGDDIEKNTNQAENIIDEARLNLLVVNSVDEVPEVGDSVNVMESTWDNQDTMAWVELECSVSTCTLGPGGTRWKGPALPLASAVQYRGFHIQDNHGVEEMFVTSMVIKAW